MANRLEMAKYNAVLQNPAAKERFQTLTNQVRLLVLSHGIKAADGEVMAVCAYLAGREFAGSAATKDTCILLGCMSNKTFDRVHDSVQNLLKPNHEPRAPTIYSLAQKYALREEHLAAVQAVQSVLYTSIPRELQDERVVCGIFALICKFLGYDYDPWIKAEERLHEIEKNDMDTMMERVTRVHGDQIKTVIQSYEPGRSRRQHASPMKKPPIPTPIARKSGALTLKRQAPEGASPRQPPAKRRKAEPVVRATSPVSSAPSSRRSASSVPPTQVTSSHHSNSSVLDLLEDEDNESVRSDGKAFSEPLESRSISPVELDFGREDIQIPESLDDLDWKALSQLRLQAITHKLKDTTFVHRIMPRNPFADRDFWEVNTYST